MESITGLAASARLVWKSTLPIAPELLGEGRRAGPGWPDPGFLTLSAFSGKTSYESSSSRTYPAARCPHQLWKRAPDMLLADLSTVQAGIAGEIRLASFSTGLFAEVESSEEQRAKAGT